MELLHEKHLQERVDQPHKGRIALARGGRGGGKTAPGGKRTFRVVAEGSNKIHALPCVGRFFLTLIGRRKNTQLRMGGQQGRGQQGTLVLQVRGQNKVRGNVLRRPAAVQTPINKYTG